MADGMIDQILFNLAVSAKPADIPNELAVDISALAMGDQITVGDLKLPAGVTTDVDAEEVVVITAHTGAAESAEGEGEDGEAAEAGSEGDAEA